MIGITTLIVFVAMFAIAFLIAVAVADPLVTTVTGYNLGGMGTQVDAIHVALVKYMVPVALGTMIVWAVIWIMRRERQTVR